MHKHLLEETAMKDSLLHRTSATFKMALLIIFIFSVVLTPIENRGSFIFYIVLVAAGLTTSKIPPIYFLKRSATIFPFVILMGAFMPFVDDKHGLARFLTYSLRAFLSVSASIIILSSAEFTRLLKGLSNLRVPKLIVMLLSFLWRYIFLMLNSFEQMSVASRARGYGLRRKDMKTTANMAGSLFLNTFERGENIYQAMLSRGFTGEINLISSERIKKKEIVLLGCIIAAMIGINII